MKGIICSTLAEANTINKKINDWMQINIQDYNAVKWGDVIKHPTLNQWFLVINEDSRNPIARLTANEKLRNVGINEIEWLPKWLPRK